MILNSKYHYFCRWYKYTIKIKINPLEDTGCNKFNTFINCCFVNGFTFNCNNTILISYGATF